MAAESKKRGCWWWTWRFGTLLVAIPPALAVLSILEVLAVRFVDPPFTLTMVQRVYEHARDHGEVRWVDSRGPGVDMRGNVPRAFVASEDGTFFLHGGFDYGSLCKAIKSRGATGGSTISQQVAKNVFLMQSRSYIRKGLEVWYVFWLETLVPKDRILELYLTVAETGPMTFGAEAGAQRHFKKPAAKLTMWQAGLMAGLLPDPRRRAVTGSSATKRANFVGKNLVPFPEDKYYDKAQEQFDNRVEELWECL